MVNLVESKRLITQAEYAKKLRPLIPPEAFLSDQNYICILPINLSILILGWVMADYLDRWNRYLLWLYLPFALVMGNSVIVSLFSTHNIMHSAVLKNPRLKQAIGLLRLTMLGMPQHYGKPFIIENIVIKLTLYKTPIATT
ncbi:MULTISPECIES: hypothetical protein [Planktothricoides]|uniref:Uncharacterized protein n=2 Tax=Planktothricoides raciborskii TaxID=132608 RepID=A0AAU8J686_9CYAN|nr:MULTISPECIES: hypothetical protein [Planktothricoides]MBD2546965.1 hypothetical protein [Planktothricoides raciborskii FACHB-1370]MBD2585494.1 hypothetical protein [Planktothricoides raciborskii FACHB-1261]